MEVFKIFAIGAEGLDKPELDQEFECDPTKETLEGIRQKIADEMLLSDTPNKVTLIRRGKDEDDEEELEKLQQTLSDALDEGDSLRFFVEPFARTLVKIKLLVETKAIKWIADQSKEFRFLVGNSRDYQATKQNFNQSMCFSNFFLFQEFPLDKSETEFTVTKKSWWRFPTQAKVALGHKSGEGYLASQFVVNNGDTLKIYLDDDQELKYWINEEKKVGETKLYSLEKSNVGKYIVKVGCKVIPVVANLAISLATA